MSLKRVAAHLAASAAMLVAVLAAGLFAVDLAQAQKKYDPGVTDTEIKIGQTVA